jgi:hypothetical protein
MSQRYTTRTKERLTFGNQTEALSLHGMARKVVQCFPSVHAALYSGIRQLNDVNSVQNPMARNVSLLNEGNISESVPNLVLDKRE